MRVAYASGTGAAELVFRYVVASGDADADGLSIAAGALALNGGTIDVAGGTTDAVLGLGAVAVTNSAGHKVAGGTLTAASVSGASITSTPAGASIYGLSERIEVTVTFNRAVDVTGTPQLALEIGAQTRQADYSSGTGTRSLVFGYVVVAGDADANGIGVGAGALTLNGGTVADARDGTTAASLGLGSNAIADAAAHKVDGNSGPPGVSGVAIGSPDVGDTFERGDTVIATVTFNKAVDVTGTPQLALTIGSAAKQANYASGSGTVSLVFRYLVVQADADTDGISIGASALSLNGGTIDVAGGTTDAVLDLGAHAVSNSAGHKVAGGSFTASSVTGVGFASNPDAGDTYGLGERIEVEVAFARAVSVTGVPQLALTVGSQTRQADYASGAGTKTLTFSYTVVIGDADSDGIGIGTSALALNGGAIADARDGSTAAGLGLGSNAIANDAAHKVDGNQGPPGVSGLVIGSPDVSDTFERGEQIEVTVTFNKAVDVTGAPQLALAIGSATRQANYASGTGTASLVFRYTVQSSDADTDGISIGASALSLNGGTIDVSGGTTDAVLGLGASAIVNSANHKVAGGTFTAASVSAVSITSEPSSDSTYGRTEQIEVEVSFTRRVTVTGVPQLALTIGSTARQAAYASGTGSNALTFRYMVTATDADTDGLSIGASALALNGGTISDARGGTGAAASLGLGANAIADAAAHKVDGNRGPPGVTSLSINSPTVGDTFERGETIEVSLVFNRSVDVTGTPQLALAIGSATRQAAYASGTGTDTLAFRYVVAAGDADSDGISIGTSALALSGGTIKVAGGTLDATLPLPSVAEVSNSAGHKVTGTFTTPAVSGVTVSSAPSSGQTYQLGESIEVKVAFSRPVTVTGAPQLALSIGSATRQAGYESASSTADTLAFGYSVRPEDADADGISIGGSALTLNGGAIADVRPGATPASLGLGTHAIANAAAHKVAGSQGPPGVVGLSVAAPPTSTTFERGDTIVATVTFNKAVDVTGAPQLALSIGSATRQASYASGTGTASLVFRYVVMSGDADADGISIGSNALALNGGTVDVSGGTTDALLSLERQAFSNSAGLRVSGATFSAASVSGVVIASAPASDGTYGLSEQIEVEVTFVRAVGVSGTPQLALTIGTETRQAVYVQGTGTPTLAFRYAVTLSDRDANGLSIGPSALALNGGTINDARDGSTAAGLALGAHAIRDASAHKVDGSRGPPGVAGVSIGAPPVGDTFERGDTVVATVTFNKAVDVTGAPQLALAIGSATKQANYASGSGTASLVFRYLVVQADVDADGISIGASALALNGGTVDVSGGTVDAQLSLGAHAIANSPNHKVAGGTFTGSSPDAVTITSAPASSGTYGLGERIEVAVTFPRTIAVTGAPQLALTVGAETRQADYASGTGTKTLTFAYTVAAGDADPDGIGVGAGALALNGGTVADGRDGTTAAALGLGAHAIANAAGHRVDATRGPPGVMSVSIAPPPVGMTFERGDAIVVTVTFNKAVRVTGTPQLALGIGSATRQANYAGGNGTEALAFRYVVASGDADTDGLSIGAGALSLNGGTIKAWSGAVDAVLSLGEHAISNSTSHKVAGGTFTASSPSGARLTSAPASGDTYGLSERVEVEVAFERPVVVTGTPQLAVGIGSATGQAGYASGSGTTALRFAYVVAAGDTDSDGISVGASALALNGGTIADARDGSTAASLGLGSNAIANAAAHKVDGSVEGSPVVAGVRMASQPSNGRAYGLGEEIRVAVRFDRTVAVTGMPQLALTIGSQTRQAGYAGGSGTVELEFAYVVQASDADANGIGMAAGALSLNGGTLVVAGGSAPAALSLGGHAIANARGHAVAGTQEDAPVVTGVRMRSSPAAGATYALSERVAVAVTFSRPVTVTGTPQLALGIGTATRPAAYASGSGTPELTFGYVVAATDADADGVSVAANALSLNGGAITIGGGSAAAALALGAHALSNVAGHLVDGSVEAVPAVAGVTPASTPIGGAYERGEAIRVHLRFDRAVTGVHELVVEAIDKGGLQTKAAATVTVADVGEAPFFGQDGWAFELAENTPGPVVLGTVEASDPDDGDALSYRLVPEGEGLFEVDASSGEVRYAGDGEDYETGPVEHALVVEATDADSLSARADVVVTVTNVNEAPSFVQDSWAFELAENQAGPVVVGTVEATDVDAADVLAYSLVSGGDGLFEVDASSGEVRYVGGGEDYESGSTTFELVLRATDEGGLTAEAGATVAVLDVNEAPEAVGSVPSQRLEVGGAPAQQELSAYFRDPDGDVLAYAAESSASDVASVSVTGGVLAIAPVSIGEAVVTVTATDSAGLSAVQTVDVVVEASRSERARVLKGVLATFGRSVGTEAVDVIGGRLGLEPSGAGGFGRSHLQLGGRAIGCDDGFVAAQRAAASAGPSGATEAWADSAVRTCGWRGLARSASGLLGLRIALPQAGTGGVVHAAGPLDAATLLFGAPTVFGAPGAGVAGSAGGGDYQGQQEPTAGEPGDGSVNPLSANPLSGRDVLERSSFQLSFGGGSYRPDDASAAAQDLSVPSGWTVWGRTGVGGFDGRPADGLQLTGGRVRSAHLGLDYRFASGLLVGLAGARTSFETGFQSTLNGAGSVDAGLTSVHPYLHWSSGDGLGLWALAGVGFGDAVLVETAGGRFAADLGMLMGALGVRRELVGGFALKADAFSVDIRSDAAADMAGVTARAQRVRLASEVARDWALGGEASLRTRLELGARLDRGDAETGVGAETGAEAAFSHAATGLSVGLRGRTLLAHQAVGLREWGAGFSLRIQPGGQVGNGLSFSVEPTWGRADGGAGTLWRPGTDAFGPAAPSVPSVATGARGAPSASASGATQSESIGWTPGRMAMELGYGLALDNGATITPFGRSSQDVGSGRRLNVGTRFSLLGAPAGETASSDIRFFLNLFGEHASSPLQPSQRRIGLAGAVKLRQ